MNLNIHGSYFAIGNLLNPFYGVDKLLNPFNRSARVTLRDKPIDVKWTRRAEREMAKRGGVLIAEMQLYFSCVVKKRVIFHDSFELPTVAVSEQLQIAFRPVQSTSCDPYEFAANYPVKREFESSAALKMHPSGLEIDFKDGEWQGVFTI